MTTNPQLIVFGHPGTEEKAFPAQPKQGGVFEMNQGQRYYIQTLAWVIQRHVVVNPKEDVAPTLQTVRLWAEHEGCAQVLAQTNRPYAKALSDAPTRVMRPLLAPIDDSQNPSLTKPGNHSLEALTYNQDPCVLTAGAFRYFIYSRRAAPKEAAII